MKSILLLSIILSAGCVVYPTSRTYFEPNKNDGNLSSSMSCGYHLARFDSLSRKTKDFYINVSPFYREGKNLHVSVSIRSEQDIVKIDPSVIEIINIHAGTTSYPSSTKVTEQKPRVNWPYFTKIIYLTYSIKTEALENISVILKDSIKVNNKSINIKKFRFKKITKNDIYYGSTNC